MVFTEIPYVDSGDFVLSVGSVDSVFVVPAYSLMLDVCMLVGHCCAHSDGSVYASGVSCVLLLWAARAGSIVAYVELGLVR